MSTSGTGCPITAIVIDDNEAHLDLVRRSLEAAAIGDRTMVVRTYARADKALAELPAEGDAVVICDYLLPGASGIDWIPDFVRADVGPVIIVTSSGDERIAAEAFRQGAADYIDKATVFATPGRLCSAITEALRRFRLEQTNKDLARRLKLANGELQKKNETLAELTETAHRFVEDVAHEFRTPLAVIKEFASIMSDGIGGDVSEKQAGYLAFISNASRDLAHLIDDFLDSGKLRARTLRVDRCEHAVSDLIESSWPMLEARAAAKRVVLEREIATGLPTVFADADKVRRSIINLVVNAIKFSDTGGVVTVSAAPDDGPGVRLTVTDRGPGLPEEEVQRLFARFGQGGEANRVSTKGFGLGLNIVKELVAINLGTVAVTSEPGRGSSFSFTLPACATEHIVDSFIARTTERSPSATLSVLRAPRTPPQTVDELRSLLASICHATDIQLPGPDGTSTIMIGETIEPDRWCRRLLRHDEDHREHASTREVGPLRVEQIGVWPVRDARDAILGILTPAVEECCV